MPDYLQNESTKEFMEMVAAKRKRKSKRQRAAKKRSTALNAMNVNNMVQKHDSDEDEVDEYALQQFTLQAPRLLKLLFAGTKVIKHDDGSYEISHGSEENFKKACNDTYHMFFKDLCPPGMFDESGFTEIDEGRRAELEKKINEETYKIPIAGTSEFAIFDIPKPEDLDISGNKQK